MTVAPPEVEVSLISFYKTYNLYDAIQHLPNHLSLKLAKDNKEKQLSRACTKVFLDVSEFCKQKLFEEEHF